MTRDEFVGVMRVYAATWPRTKLRDDTLDAWYPSFENLPAAEAYEAIKRLGEENDLMPMLAPFVRTTKAVVAEYRGEQAPEVNPAQDPKNFPTTPYLREAKRLIYGAGQWLLLTPVSELDTEGAGLKAKVLDCAARHHALLEGGHKPDADMLVEVANLTSAVLDYVKRQADRIEGERAERARKRAS